MIWGEEFVGKEVVVLMGVDTDGQEVWMSGQLVNITDDGEFAIDTVDEGRLYCWPAMKIVEVA